MLDESKCLLLRSLGETTSFSGSKVLRSNIRMDNEGGHVLTFHKAHPIRH